MIQKSIPSVNPFVPKLLSSFVLKNLVHFALLLFFQNFILRPVYVLQAVTGGHASGLSLCLSIQEQMRIFHKTYIMSTCRTIRTTTYTSLRNFYQVVKLEHLNNNIRGLNSWITTAKQHRLVVITPSSRGAGTASRGALLILFEF